MSQTKGFVIRAALLALAVIPGSITLACGAMPATTPLSLEIPANYTTYTDESNVFSISYPSDWESALKPLGLEQGAKQAATDLKAGIPVEKTTFMFFGGRRPSTGSEPNLFVVVEPLPAGTWTLDGAVEAEMEKEKAGWLDLRELPRIKTTVDSREAIILEWQGTDEEVGKLHNVQLYTIADKTVWIVTCMAIAGNFAEWENDFNIIVRSLRISN